MNRLVVDINRVLCSSTDGSKFATFFCGIYDDSNRTLTYVNAGHNPPMWFKRGRLAAGSDSTSSGDPASDSVKTGGRLACGQGALFWVCSRKRNSLANRLGCSQEACSWHSRMALRRLSTPVTNPLEKNDWKIW